MGSGHHRGRRASLARGLNGADVSHDIFQINPQAAIDAAAALGRTIAMPADGAEQIRAAERNGFELEALGQSAIALLDEVVEELGALRTILDSRAELARLADQAGGQSNIDPSDLMAILGLVDRTGLALAGSLDDGTGTTALEAGEFADLAERERILLDGTPQELRDYYLNKALERAGIDGDDWDPSLGLDHNADTVENVYEYYAELYRDGTDHLWWSGMAALIGPSFYGGFQDLETFADLFGRGADIAGYASQIPGGHQIPAAGADLSAEALEDELRWYQERLMTMQQEIFFDMAPAHEAYNDIGMRGIEAMLADDPYGYGPETIAAWQQLDDGRRTGDQNLVAEGNGALLLREQLYIIDDDYTEMRNRPITGEVTTYLMTAIGSPSVPGAQSYPEVFPLEVDASQYVGTPRQVTVIPRFYTQDLPHVGAEGTVSVTLPLPDGNIAGFEDRWALIETDTLPTYVDLAANHPDQVLDVLDTPVGERADAFTIDEWWDDLAVQMIEGFDIDIDIDFQAGL